MEIRKAEAKDLSGILKVLKKSLGETSSEKTESVWNYKHTNNPFGKSLVLVACIDNKIVGVRAFMYWKWQSENKVFSAFRAVDTATDPDFQGRGIFKKLTLKALEIGQIYGVNFVFNTPNEQSKPGYLKMGWREVNQIRLTISPCNPFNFFKQGQFNPSINENCSESDFNALLDKYNSTRAKQRKLFTPKDETFLTWRYENNVLQSYHVVKSKDYFLAAYLKNHKNYKELRVSELIYISEKGKSKAKKTISELSNEYAANFVSYAQDDFSGMLSFTGHFGPVLTLKELNLNDRESSSLLNLGNWGYSLGDLELF